MAPRESASSSATVVKFPGGSSRRRQNLRILRLAAEHDGLCILYAHHALSPSKLFAVKILCWGLLEDGSVVALFPWLNRIARCQELTDPESGAWEGYYNPLTGDIFNSPPEHKVLELEAAQRFFKAGKVADDSPIQEVPDHIGSHAALVDEEQHMSLHEVLSWRLLGSGDIQAMLPDPDKQAFTPVLPGDDCLYAAQESPGFRYFFQYHIANQIKSGDPLAVRAITRLLDS